MGRGNQCNDSVGCSNLALKTMRKLVALAFGLALLALPARGEEAVAVEILSGVTTRMKILDGPRETVVLNCVVPDPGANRTAAVAFLRNALLGKSVRLERRANVYVKLPNGQDLGAAIVGGGYGFAYTATRCERLDDYKDRERTARGSFRGLWNPETYKKAARGGRVPQAGKITDLGLEDGSVAAQGHQFGVFYRNGQAFQCRIFQRRRRSCSRLHTPRRHTCQGAYSQPPELETRLKPSSSRAVSRAARISGEIAAAMSGNAKGRIEPIRR